MNPIRVLIADDHTLFRKGLRALLDRQPAIEVIGEAEDGGDALQKASQLSPDVILIDISMPVLDGFEATRQIKEKFPNCKVLILTMYTDKEYILRSLEAGASGYISKDATPAETVSAIETVYQKDAFLSPLGGKLVVGEYLKQANTGHGWHPLTTREREILRLIAKGLSDKEIARALFISRKTVANHRFHIMKKLGIHNAAGLAIYAIRMGIGLARNGFNQQFT